MSGFWGYSRARISARNPQSLGRCDRCGFTWNLKELRWQYYWRGTTLENTNFLVCRDCLDVPNENVRTLILPPDPVPVLNPRIEDYVTETTSYIATESLIGWLTEDGNKIITETGNPNNSYLQTQDGSQLVTQDGNPIVTQTETPFLDSLTS